MNKIGFSLILIVVLIISSEARKSKRECIGALEDWGCESGTPQCHRLCKNKNIGKFRACTQDCLYSCVCKNGFLRDGEDGECVPEDECPLA